MALQDVLAFVRQATPDIWEIMIREMNATRKRRNEEAANLLRPGDMVRFEPPDKSQAAEGRIVKIHRGRVVMLIRSEEERLLQRFSVPAEMVRKCA